MVAILGIDPGVGGGIALIQGTVVEATKMPETPHDLADWIESRMPAEGYASAFVENVASSPQMGVKSAFTFGQGYGIIQGVLAAQGVPYVLVRPQQWMKALAIPKKRKDEKPAAWKGRLKAEAQRRYPAQKITLATADALLIATYGQQTWHTEAGHPEGGAVLNARAARGPASELRGAGRATFPDDLGLIRFPEDGQ